MIIDKLGFSCHDRVPMSTDPEITGSTSLEGGSGLEAEQRHVLQREVRGELCSQMEQAENLQPKFCRFSLSDLGINQEEFLPLMGSLYGGLEWDRYDVERGLLKEPCRRRGIAQFLAERGSQGWEVRRVPAEPYVQPADHGSYDRTTPRVYPDVSLDSSQEELVLQLLRAVSTMVPEKASAGKKLRIIVTFLRTVARGDAPSPCALEGGPHYDGMDYIVSALVINRANLKEGSGESSVLTPHGTVLLRTILQPGDGIFQDDKNLMHNITPIQLDPSGGSAEGCRDMMGVDVQIL